MGSALAVPASSGAAVSTAAAAAIARSGFFIVVPLWGSEAIPTKDRHNRSRRRRRKPARHWRYRLMPWTDALARCLGPMSWRCVGPLFSDRTRRQDRPEHERERKREQHDRGDDEQRVRYAERIADHPVDRRRHLARADGAGIEHAEC